jgi:vacuolar-type H+-ATPase subunit E/Vma4
MSYDVLIAALLEEGDARCKEILRKARSNADRLLADAAAAAETLDWEADQSVQDELARRHAEAMSRASLARRHILLRAKHRVLDAVWTRVTELAAALAGPQRTRIMSACIEELLEAAPPGPLTVIVDRRERAGLAPSLGKRNLAVEERLRDDLVLGAEVVGGGAVLRTSLSTRLTKAKPKLLVELNRLLFGEQAMGHGL